MLKVGKALKDQNVKSIKKLIKDNVLPLSNIDIPAGWSEFKNAVIKVTAVRKYVILSSTGDRRLYEVDVVCDMRNFDGYLWTTEWNRLHPRRVNGYYRRHFEKLVREEMKYFGLGSRDEIVVKNIKYEVIV